MSFLTDYFGVGEGVTEQAVRCPFPHTLNSSDLTYFENNPSAHVNTVNKLFHCKACGRGYSELQFIQEILNCNLLNARYLQICHENDEDVYNWNISSTLHTKTKEKAEKLGISTQTLNSLLIKSQPNNPEHICFPVFMYGHLVDIRTYCPNEKPKWKSRTGARAGLIIPFDIWRISDPNRITLICAGEKDMAVARSYGFNAINITGGENCLPISFKEFIGKKCVIVYDNDYAGKQGAINLANNLLNYAESVKVCTNFHEVCCEKSEDISDFFIKYNKSKNDLINYIENTPLHVFTSIEKNKANLTTLDLRTAASPKYLNKLVRTNIQVAAVSEQTFSCCSTAFGEKYKIADSENTMQKGELRTWELTNEHAQDILHLMDNNFTEEKIKDNMRKLLKIPLKEKNVAIKLVEKTTIFKVFVTDLYETATDKTQPMEFLAYCIGCKLESGKKYLVTHKLTPHPYKGQQLIMIIVDAEQANDSVTNFSVQENEINQLKLFQNLQGSIAGKIKTLSNKTKGLLGYNGNDQLIQTIDFAYHTPLQFDFGNFKNIRGYLDTFIVGESRVGKSSTAETLRQTYGLGTFASLAGNSATIAGLIGGSNKTTNGAFQTRAGVIPQNHRGLIIFEEFGKSQSNIIAELTDIRSSNEVRIARVSGTLTLPATVRMITLSNVKAVGGTTKAINAYPNGISILTELVPTIEDIARYDMVLILGDKGNSQIDPFWQPDTPLPIEAYKTRIRWVWSRTPEQIVIDNEIGHLILEHANELNKEYDCHIKIFGTEAWKKLARLSIAIAGYLVSTDDNYQKIIVKKEHVLFASQFLIDMYDNPTFKLKEFVNLERKYTTIDEEAIAALQDLFIKVPALILQFEQNAVLNKQILMASTGMEPVELNKTLNRMTQCLFIKFQNHDIIPTERFRIGMTKINRRTNVPRLGGDY